MKTRIRGWYWTVRLLGMDCDTVKSVLASTNLRWRVEGTLNRIPRFRPNRLNVTLDDNNRVRKVTIG